MKLMTPELEAQFPPLYSSEGKKAEEIRVIAKFFYGSWTWYATEYDKAEGVFFGLVKGHDCEFGYFSLSELESYKGLYCLGIERDLFWDSNITLDQVMKTLV